MIYCIAASADGQIMCSTAEDKSLKVFDVVNFGELGKYILYIIIHKEAIYTNCFYLDLKVVTKKIDCWWPEFYNWKLAGNYLKGLLNL